MNRRDIALGIAAFAVPSIASATYSKPKPKPCNCPPGEKGEPGPPGPQGPPGEPGKCECKHPKLSMHWDGEVFINGIGHLPNLQSHDIVASIPGPKFNDELWYYRQYDAIAYFDYNREVPHVIVFKRGGESEVQRPDGFGPWDRISGIGHQLVSYVGNNQGRAHHCIVSLDKSIAFARSKNWIYLDWTPLSNFTTFGSLPIFVEPEIIVD